MEPKKPFFQVFVEGSKNFMLLYSIMKEVASDIICRWKKSHLVLSLLFWLIIS